MSEENRTPAEEPAEPRTEPQEEPQTETPAEEPAKTAKKKKDITLTQEQAAQVDASLKQLETVKDQLLRLTAEYDNYRKRTAKEKESLYQDAKADTVKAFLAVYDNLERAVGAEGGEDSPHKKGLEMIFHQYREILKNLGVTEIEAQGAVFDPEVMEAVLHVEDENLEENTVSQVFQAGWV